MNQQQIPVDYLLLQESEQNAIEQAYNSGQHVYFILSEAHNLIKIGVARNPGKRLSVMQTGSPTQLNLVHVIPYGSYWLESKLHRHFKHLRKQGEWFNYAPMIKDFISNTKQLLQEQGMTWNNQTQVAQT